FTNDLATWAVQHQISHIALRALLQRLKQYSCFSTLPIDARSILKTPRQQDIRIVPPGTYHHFGVSNSVLKILSSVKESIDCIKITINIDGLPLTKSSQQQFWPILGSIVSYNNVFMIGVYHGNEKPADVNDFLKYFVDEMKDLCENGINIQGRNIPCRLEALICDTPAKAFVLCVKGHSGYSSCTKCQTEGQNVQNRICFPQVDAPLRTDEDFIRKIDDDYHKLEYHILNLSNVPLDYMHLICLGIMRKLIYLWVEGDLHYRLRATAVEAISICLVVKLKPSIPVEFARKPRKIECVKMWKATEYRLILLYTGPLDFKSVLKKDVYTHFMILHVIIRILSSENLKEYINYAQDLILYFIKKFIQLYGIQNVSHNVHNLMHLVEDVKKFGPLDNFSAFKFENYMQTLKKYIRKADRPLQQVIRRHEEGLNLSSVSSTISSNSDTLMSLHYDGPLTLNCKNPQYKMIKYNGIVFEAGSLADSCCGLNDGTIVSIANIAYCTKRTIPVIIGYELLRQDNLFNVPCPSSLLGIYIVHLCSNLKSWPLQSIVKKYIKLLYEENRYAVFPLIHTQT
ncbi:hypothetical protein ALC62_10457, partial [Cyphomyrmex costatus]